MDVFVLHHVHTFDNGDEDVKLIGVYSSLVTAQTAITRLKYQPGFRELPEGFTISQYRVDTDHWIEGYTTMDPKNEHLGVVLLIVALFLRKHPTISPQP
jgi:hypothetical protein